MLKVKRKIPVIINGQRTIIETAKENFNVAAYLARFKKPKYDVGRSVTGGIIVLNKSK